MDKLFWLDIWNFLETRTPMATDGNTTLDLTDIRKSVAGALRSIY